MELVVSQFAKRSNAPVQHFVHFRQ